MSSLRSDSFGNPNEFQIEVRAVQSSNVLRTHGTGGATLYPVSPMTSAWIVELTSLCL